MSAITEEMIMNTTTSTRRQISLLVSFIFFTTVPEMKSKVRVELDVRTSDESVDMEADKTIFWEDLVK